jgi:hypothetical protein
MAFAPDLLAPAIHLLQGINQPRVSQPPIKRLDLSVNWRRSRLLLIANHSSVPSLMRLCSLWAVEKVGVVFFNLICFPFQLETKDE